MCIGSFQCIFLQWVQGEILYVAIFLYFFILTTDMWGSSVGERLTGLRSYSDIHSSLWTRTWIFQNSILALVCWHLILLILLYCLATNYRSLFTSSLISFEQTTKSSFHKLLVWVNAWFSIYLWGNYFILDLELLAEFDFFTKVNFFYWSL